MALSKIQQALVTKVRVVAGGELGVRLDDETCCYLVGVIAEDLKVLKKMPEIPQGLPYFFSKGPLSELRLPGKNFLRLFEALIRAKQDADAYFFCLAILHKARLKYERILEAQPIPSIDQVGPRSLLQFGKLSPRALASLLIWRKWLYDVDNRAAQETGYVFEPIIAHSIGGVPASAAKSPIKRRGTGTGRQVDCLIETERQAYEMKLRVTIAASGQGRWQEELSFPADCKASGYKPILLVLDPTNSTKLSELRAAFRKQGGKAYVGDEAWSHLESRAGSTMGVFLEKYVRRTLQELLKESTTELPEFSVRKWKNRLILQIGDEKMEIDRAENSRLDEVGAGDFNDEDDPLG